MVTFASRLKEAIDKRGLSQAQAARLAGISQQSINYIINNDLKTSKLAPKIAATLEINPEWLIYGRGKFEETKVYEIPILHSPYMLKKFIANQLDENSLEYTFIDLFLGNSAFAYLIQPSEMLICSDKVNNPTGQYLTFNGASVSITDNNGELSFQIIERRTRYVDF